VPLYEQAKIDEKKDYPVLQVIDYAVPPGKKSYPPRMLFALVGAASVTIIVYVGLIIRGAAQRAPDARWVALLKEAKDWTWKAPRHR
jgi:uncharacterized protein involved in exopolysaccharide biosynthesis